MPVSVISAARAVLVAALPGLEIVQTFPGTPARRAIRLTRAGGGRGRDLDRPRLIVECFAASAAGAPDGKQAEKDAYIAYDALRAAANGGPWAGAWITGWDGDNIVDFPDPDQTRHARWQFTGVLYLLT